MLEDVTADFYKIHNMVKEHDLQDICSLTGQPKETLGSDALEKFINYRLVKQVPEVSTMGQKFRVQCKEKKKQPDWGDYQLALTPDEYLVIFTEPPCDDIMGVTEQARIFKTIPMKRVKVKKMKEGLIQVSEVKKGYIFSSTSKLIVKLVNPEDLSQIE
jgi:hypothetical protein